MPRVEDIDPTKQFTLPVIAFASRGILLCFYWRWRGDVQYPDDRLDDVDPDDDTTWADWRVVPAYEPDIAPESAVDDDTAPAVRPADVDVVEPPERAPSDQPVG